VVRAHPGAAQFFAFFYYLVKCVTYLDAIIEDFRAKYQQLSGSLKFCIFADGFETAEVGKKHSICFKMKNRSSLDESAIILHVCKHAPHKYLII
jgi:hypothetical protein